MGKYDEIWGNMGKWYEIVGTFYQMYRISACLWARCGVYYRENGIPQTWLAGKFLTYMILPLQHTSWLSGGTSHQGQRTADLHPQGMAEWPSSSSFFLMPSHAFASFLPQHRPTVQPFHRFTTPNSLTEWVTKILIIALQSSTSQIVCQYQVSKSDLITLGRRHALDCNSDLQQARMCNMGKYDS